MKGLVFTELLEMAETVLTEDEIDAILDAAPLQSGGAYSRVGNYGCHELITLVMAFSHKLNLSPETLQQKFGHWMFKSFAKGYPEFLTGRSGAFEMLEAIEDEVHVEVRKLYPDAELPKFETRRVGPDSLVMSYSSERPLKHFCLGLIEACVEYFEESASISLLENDGGEANVAEFLIKKDA